MTNAEAESRLETCLVRPEASITEAVRQLEAAGTGVLLLCDAARRLEGILTDGDVRRAILRGLPFSSPCRSIATPDPVVGSADVTPVEALRRMDEGRSFIVHQLPLVGDDRRVVGLVLRSDFTSQESLAISAVVMAGGFGTRLRPLTDQVPKPMLPVGESPLLARTIARLRDAGIRRVNVTTHYLPEEITGYFGDGHDFGVELNYLPESRPLGTAGGLRLVPPGDQPILVINGDVLTGVRFRDMLAFHRLHGADLTVGIKSHEVQIPYGVVDCAGPFVRGVREKPVLNVLINAGVYLVEPAVRRSIADGERLDMTDLVARLIAEGRTVVSFPIVEYWLDVGRPADYEKAQEDIKRVRL